MSELPFELLMAMASKDEQIRYIDGATKDTYLVPCDLLNDAWHFCERALGTENLALLNAEQREATDNLKALIHDAPDGLEDREGIVEDPDWHKIRQQAHVVLTVFQQSLPNR